MIDYIEHWRQFPNRTMRKLDLLEVPEMVEAREAICRVAERVTSLGGHFCSWVGTLDDAHRKNTEANKGPDYVPLPETVWLYDRDIPWFTLWEYCWTLAQVRRIRPLGGLHVLSLGGNACLLDLALLDLGHRVTLVERRSHAAEQQEINAALLGHDDAFGANVGAMESWIPTMVKSGTRFDAMTSTNVLFLAGDNAQRAVAQHLHKLIVPGGFAAFTYDYLNPNPARTVSNPLEHWKWEGFKPEVRMPPGGGPVFYDNGERHHLFYPQPELGHYTAASMLQMRV